MITTNKRELFEYLKKHDQEFLEFLKAAKKEFGEIEFIGYVKKRT